MRTETRPRIEPSRHKVGTTFAVEVLSVESAAGYQLVLVIRDAIMVHDRESFLVVGDLDEFPCEAGDHGVIVREDGGPLGQGRWALTKSDQARGGIH